MKPVMRNVLAALGLLPLSIFADTTEETPRFGGQAPYAGQANITGIYGSSGSSYAEADFWQPIWQTWDVACIR